MCVFFAANYFWTWTASQEATRGFLVEVKPAQNQLGYSPLAPTSLSVTSCLPSWPLAVCVCVCVFSADHSSCFQGSPRWEAMENEIPKTLYSRLPKSMNLLWKSLQPKSCHRSRLCRICPIHHTKVVVMTYASLLTSPLCPQNKPKTLTPPVKNQSKQPL